MKSGLIKLIMTVAAAATFVFNPSIDLDVNKEIKQDTVQYRSAVDPGGAGG